MGDEVLVGWQELEEFTRQVFEQVGMSSADAQVEAEVLVWANRRGVDSHGVQRVPSYVKAAQTGRYKVRPDVKVEKETPAALLIEADHGFGPPVTVYAMHKTIEKARQVGIGWCNLRNITHQGAMGYYALMAAQAGMAGIAFVCNPPNMAIYGAKVAGVHNSPIAIAVPGDKHPPLVLDIATSVAARGKIDLAVEKDIPIPLGWAIDKDGRPTTDPNEVAVVLPFGDYKGSGLALMFACLASLMVGNPLLAPRLLDLPNQAPLGTQNSVVAAVNIATFTDLGQFRQNVDQLVQAEKGLPKADGFSEILMPGEVEDRVRAQRERDGIPIPVATAAKLREVAAELGLKAPESLG